MKKFDLNKDVVYTFGTVETKEDFDPNTGLSVFDQNGFIVGNISGSYYGSYYDSNLSGKHVQDKFIDLSFGVSVSSSIVNASEQELGNVNYYPQKLKNYRRFAQAAFGSPDKIFTFDNIQKHELIFISLPRDRIRDGIKDRTFSLETIATGSSSGETKRFFLDKKKDDNSHAGKVGSLILTKGNNGTGVTDPSIEADKGKIAGNIYYDIGLLVLVPELIALTASTNNNFWGDSGDTYEEVITNSSASSVTLEESYDALNSRIDRILYINYSKVCQTFYTCTAKKDEFNYSPNPSFTDNDGKINTFSGSQNFAPSTYITKVGLLGENQELIAVGNLNKPVRKTPEKEVRILVRLDY